MPVTSVGLGMPPEFSVANSPITGSGILEVTWQPIAAGLALQGPDTGPDAVPTFRPITGTLNPIVATLGVLTNQVGLFGDNPIDGTWTVYDNEVVILMGQTDKKTNGPWRIKHLADWVRPFWFADGKTIQGTVQAFVRSLTIMGSATDVALFIVPFTGDDQTPFIIGTDQINVQYADPLVSVEASSGVAVMVDTSRPGRTVYQLTSTVTSSTVVEGTNVSVVESPAGTFTVSVPSFPYADLTGAPDIPVITSSDGSISVDTSAFPLVDITIASGALPATVSLAATQITAGTFPAGVLIPYTQVTSAPASVTTFQQSATGSVPSGSYTTVYDSGTFNAMLMGGGMKNTSGAGNIDLRVTYYNLSGATTDGTNLIAPGQAVAFNPVTAPNPGASNVQFGPISRYIVLARGQSGTNGYDIEHAYVAW